MGHVTQINQIKRYFNTWLTKDFSQLTTVFNDNCYYQECYGPGYHGTEEIQAWVEHQKRVQSVQCWDVQHV